ncbi:hypothetical protein JANAI62_20930 [Jannaschia pagri]|uniref:Uncharacterized protein n=1 Tax=Jannaschia pagri TaxID=2829797 RepID=A0ABQ4NM29_9RHOB|nr:MULTISPECIES: hypothetical protein [unclassified Jannaschia]GIT91636.1 hypothetical protein JANAI61_20940 [Jannaschia sp. AI_61]GIT95470.1 hypothetical protein JANAI62_20930 [Jannaschia sp. AI_62]
MTYLALLSDGLLVIATLGMATYCWVLSKRLAAPPSPAPQAAEIDHLTQAVDALRADVEALRNSPATEETLAPDPTADQLAAQIDRADDRIGRIEILLAGLEEIETDLVMRADAADAADAAEDTITIPQFRPTRSHPMVATPSGDMTR